MRNKRTLLLMLASAVLGLAACANPAPSGTASDRTQSSRLSIMESGGGGGGGGGY